MSTRTNQSGGPGRRRFGPDTVGGLVVLLLLVVLLPLLVVQAAVYGQRLETRRDEELKANVEVARATAGAFAAQIRALLREELALGLAFTSPAFDPDRAAAVLATVVGDYRSVESMSWWTPSGEVVASSGPAANVAIEAFEGFRSLREGAEVFVSDLVRERDHGGAVFVVGRAIHAPGGALRAVVTATVLPARLGERALGLPLGGEGRHVYLADRQGTIAHLWPDEDGPSVRRSLADEALYRSLRGKRPVSGLLVIDGRTELAGLAPVGDFGWVAGASRPEPTALAPVLEGIARTGGVTLAVAAAAFGFALWLGRRITGPLATLERRTLAFGRGRLEVDFPEQGPAELRRLGRTFSDMAENIREHAATLEARRREAERARKLLLTVLDTLPAGVFVSDRDGRLILDNASARRQLGSTEGWTAWGPAEGYLLLAPDGEPYPAEALPLAQAVTDGRETAEAELRVRRPDGTEQTLLSAARPVRDEDGRITGGVAVFQDITARKLAEEERERLAEHVRLLLESTDQGIYGVDLEGRCTFINRAAARMLGFDPDTLVGRDIHALVHHSHADGRPYPREACPVHRVRRDGLGARVEDEVLWRRDGTSFPVEYSSYPMHSGPAVSGIVVAFFDITERRLAEAERARLLTEREDLLRTVSHDLRTPLTVMMAQAQALGRTLGETPEEEPRRQRVRAIVTAGRRMNGMIQNVVDAARLDVDAIAPSPTEVDLAGFLEDLRLRLSSALDLERVRLEVPDRLPAAHFDPDHLERILTNLVSNALKYSEEGTPVRVSVREVEGGLELSVADRGPGIPADELPHLFERYRRGAGVGRREGLGLGLYITKRLVEVGGGQLRAESTPGEGSTFTVILPRA